MINTRSRIHSYRRGPYRIAGSSPLRAARIAQGITQAELAVRMGTTQAVVSELERGGRVTGELSIEGRPSLRERAARALGEPVERLFPEASEAAA